QVNLFRQEVLADVSILKCLQGLRHLGRLPLNQRGKLIPQVNYSDAAAPRNTHESVLLIAVYAASVRLTLRTIPFDPSCNRFCLSSSILLDGPDRRLDRGHIAVTLRDTAVPLGLCCRHLLLSFLKDSLSLLQSCTGKSQGFRSRLVAIPRPDH